MNNFKSRKIINKGSDDLSIDIFEFLPFEIKNRPKLVQAFYNTEPVIISSDNERMIHGLLSNIYPANSSVKNQAVHDHIMQAVFCLLEDVVSYSSIHIIFDIRK